jgi:hypothetical protein
MNRLSPSHRLISALISCLVILPAAVAARQSSEAGIIGQVVDQSGSALPGVTVTVSSPALQVGRVSAVTNERGEYRVTPLPIGTYSLEYALLGFSTVRREGVRLTVGFTAKLDVQLTLGALEETVTVSGASPVVDVTSTTTTTRLTREALEATPTSRNSLNSLLVQVPGARPPPDVGGNTLNAAITFRAYGQSADAWQRMEGVFTGSPKAIQSGNYYDYASIEEATIGAIGHGAEVPSRGLQMNVIVKSGGNDFHGIAAFDGTHKRFQSTNNPTATGTNKLEGRHDVSGDLGGRILRNKLWFYVGARRRTDDNQVLNAFMPDGSPAIRTSLQRFATEKFTYQLSKNNKIVGFHNWAAKNEAAGFSQFVPWESRTLNYTRTYTPKIEWQAVRGSALVMSLQYGTWKTQNPYGTTSSNVATIDRGTQYQSGDNLNSGNVVIEARKHLTGYLSWYRSGWLGGNHEVKSGFDFMPAYVLREWKSRASGNYRLGFRNGAPDQIETWNFPAKPPSDSRYLGMYVQDNWSIRRRLTVNVGLRFAHDQGYVPAQCRSDAVPVGFGPAACFDRIDFNTWNAFAPRVAAAFDLTGDGKTVIKGGWGRFNHMRLIEEVGGANKNRASTTSWRWRDPNGDRQYQAGEVNLDPNGPDFISVTPRDAGSSLYANGVPNPNEKEPQDDQFNVSFERELFPNFGVRATGVYARAFNQYRILNVRRPYDSYNVVLTAVDPGPDGVVGTADDPGKILTFWDYPRELSGLANQVETLVNDPNSTNTYTSYEFVAAKRMSNRWQAMASFSNTKLNQPFGLQSALNPTAEINSANLTWEWVGRISGSYLLWGDVSLAVNYSATSGAPLARTVVVSRPQSGTTTLRVEPLGAIRLPNLHLVDFRAEKTFRLRKSNRLSARVNVYNLTNANTVTGRTIQSGASYLTPTSQLVPRVFSLSASYAF